MSTELIRLKELDSAVHHLSTGAHLPAVVRSRGQVLLAPESHDIYAHQRSLWAVLPVYYPLTAHLKTLITPRRRS